MKKLGLNLLLSVSVLFQPLADGRHHEADSEELEEVVQAYNDLTPQIIELAKSKAGQNLQVPDLQTVQIDVDAVEGADKYDADTINLLKAIIVFAKKNQGKAAQLQKNVAAFKKSNAYVNSANKGASLERFYLQQSESLDLPEYEEFPWVQYQLMISEKKSNFQSVEEFDAHYAEVYNRIDRLDLGYYKKGSPVREALDKVPGFSIFGGMIDSVKYDLCMIAARYRPIDEDVWKLSGPDAATVELSPELGEVPRDAWIFENGQFRIDHKKMYAKRDKRFDECKQRFGK